MTRDNLRKMSIEERLALVDDLLESIDPNELLLTEAQKRELDRRIEHIRLHPEEGVPWEVVKTELMSKLHG